VALHDAVTWLAGRRALAGRVETVMHRSIQAVSVGIIEGEPRLDLMYDEDVAAEVDMNVVATGDGDFVEVQGTGEAGVFRRDQLDALLDLALLGCAELAGAQQKALAA
jgi:ribonuclease PH